MAEQDVRSQTNGGSRPGEQQKEQQEPPKDPAKAKRRRTIVIAVLAVVAIGLFLYWLHSRNFEDTDDAQVDGNLTAVSSRVPGTVTAVHVDDNQEVKQGDLLVELDPADLQVALAQAKAAVALAQAQLQSEQPLVPMTQSTNVATLSSAEDEVASAQADMDAAQRDLDQSEAQNRFAQQQLARAKQLVTSNTIPQSELDQRQSAADAAAAAVAAARKRIDQRRARLQQAEARRKEAQANAPRQLSARTATLSVRQANLELAQAQLKQAELNLGYARIVAPVAGIAGKRSVNVGDRVGPGQQLMSITQVGDLWVTANFRETQIEHMRVGQRTRVHVDALSVDLDGELESFAGATGSRYSLLPPENASGNYVKVVQRIPVRLRFNPGQPDMERLRPGMSAEPKVRVR